MMSIYLNIGNILTILTLRKERVASTLFLKIIPLAESTLQKQNCEQYVEEMQTGHDISMSVSHDIALL